MGCWRRCPITLKPPYTLNPSFLIELTRNFLAGLPVGPDWLALPDDVLYTVFEWLPIATLVRASEVCRGWRGVARDHGLWARLYSSEFGLGGRLVIRSFFFFLWFPTVMLRFTHSYPNARPPPPKKNQWLGVRFTRASCVCEEAGGNGSESSSSLSTSFEAATPSCLIHPHAGSPPRSDAAPLLYPRRVPAEAWQFEYFGRRKLELDVSPRQVWVVDDMVRVCVCSRFNFVFFFGPGTNLTPLPPPLFGVVTNEGDALVFVRQRVGSLRRRHHLPRRLL